MGTSSQHSCRLFFDTWSLWQGAWAASMVVQGCKPTAQGTAPRFSQLAVKTEAVRSTGPALVPSLSRGSHVGSHARASSYGHCSAPPCAGHCCRCSGRGEEEDTLEPCPCGARTVGTSTRRGKGRRKTQKPRQAPRRHCNRALGRGRDPL